MLLTSVIWMVIFGARGQTQPADKWAQDIDILCRKIETYHPAPWTRISRTAFYQRADHIKQTLAGRSDQDVIVDIMRLVALLRDGHTQVWLNNQDAFNRCFPVRLEKFSDGVFVTAVDRTYSSCLGAQVTRMGSMSMDDAYRAISGAVPSDSDHSIARAVSNYLSNAEILKALKIVPTSERLPLEVRLPGGEKQTVVLESAEWEPSLKWAYAKNAAPTRNETIGIFDGRKEPLPRYLRHVWPERKTYWFELIPEDKILYFQFNEVGDSDDEPFSDFVTRLFRFYDEHTDEIERFVIDVRFNEGGNGYLLPPLVHEFIKRQAGLPRGKLLIIAGKDTFSAATNFIGQMLKETRAITVGDIAGGPLNWYSDVFKFVLPNTGLIVDISTMCWQEGHPTDSRGYYPPDVYLPMSAKDYFSGRDVVMEAIRDGQVTPLTDVLLNQGVGSFKAALEKTVAKYGPTEKWFPYISFDLTMFALYNLAPAGKIDEAFELSKLNTRLYPGEIRAWYAMAMCHQAKNQLPEALACFERIAETEPDHAEVKWNIDRLKALVNKVAVDAPALRRCVGRFGIRTITFENGDLHYQREGRDKVKLIPMTTTCFIMEGDDDNRVEILLQGDEAAGIRTRHYNGTSRFYPRTRDKE